MFSVWAFKKYIHLKKSEDHNFWKYKLNYIKIIQHQKGKTLIPNFNSKPKKVQISLDIFLSIYQ